VGQGDRPNLRVGTLRTLTNSEVKRHYIFISRSKKLRQELGTGSINVEFNGKRLASKILDSSGRIYVGYDVLKEAKVGQRIDISLRSQNTISIRTTK